MKNILNIHNLRVGYHNTNNQYFNIIDNLSINIVEGEIYAIAGESGCGKSTLAKTITKLIKPENGYINFYDQNINEIDKKDFTPKIQMIFQNPYSSLNPKMKIKDILQEPLDINTTFSKTRKLNIIKQTANDVGLDYKSLDLYPHEFSGGQRQRIAIARALILNPNLIIADEPVSALDASIQAQIINLLKALKKERNLTILFISHDLNIIRYLADRVGIMNAGKIVEENNTYQIFNNPKNKYTKELLKSAPTIKY